MVIGNEESQKVYIGIDGQPGDQWIRTKRGWRISESEDDPESPPETDVKNILEKHVQRQSKKLLLKESEGIKGAPPSRAGPSENLPYLPLVTKTTPESGYTTLGEAIRRLNFIEALKDPKKFNYILHIVKFTVEERILSISGCAIRGLFKILTKMIDVMEERSNFEARDELDKILIFFEAKLREFKKILSCSHSAVDVCIDRCDQLRSRMKKLRLPEIDRIEGELNLETLPIGVQDKIMLTLNNLKDFESLSEATPMFGDIAYNYEYVHMENLIDRNWDENQQRDWKLPIWKSNADPKESHDLNIDEKRSQFLRLQKKHGNKVDYPLMMKYCTKTSVLFWEDASHPYKTDLNSEFIRFVSPRDFLTFFDQK